MLPSNTRDGRQSPPSRIRPHDRKNGSLRQSGLRTRAGTGKTQQSNIAQGAKNEVPEVAR